MPYPNTIKERPNVDRKLGIKSSMRYLMPLFALVYSLWKSDDYKDSIEYSTEAVLNKTSIEISDEQFNKVKTLFSEENNMIGNDAEFRAKLNENPLFKSQIESLIVSLGLFWTLAKISFVDPTRPVDAERQGGNRYSKKISYTINVDIMDLCLTDEDKLLTDNAKSLLFNWLINYDYLPDEGSSELGLFEKIISLLTIFSEKTHFKIKADGEDIVFMQEGVYELLSSDSQNRVDARKPVGPFRILNSSIRKHIHPYLNKEGTNIVLNSETDFDKFVNYARRVSNYLDLIETATKIESIQEHDFDENWESFPRNIIFYGPPGTGKSRKARELIEGFCNNVVTTTFHPEYDYSDFVGVYKPIAIQDGDNDSITYKFEPGFFTKAYIKSKETTEPVVLLIEEINRGNCAGIFGDLFQLLDRRHDGSSEYIVDTPEELRKYFQSGTNIEEDILKFPNNFFIYATMNTSDQSLFPMDSAFKRRWYWNHVPINYEDANNLSLQVLGHNYSWKDFIEKMNEKIYKITHSEDKEIGNRFVNPRDGIIDEKIFVEKILFYLWNDVFKDENPDNEYNIFKYISDPESGPKPFRFSELFIPEKETIIRGFFEHHNIAKIKTQQEQETTQTDQD